MKKESEEKKKKKESEEKKTKKIFKIIGIIFIVGLLLILGVLVCLKIGDKKDESETTNVKTLMGYIETHNGYGNIVTKDFKCDALDNIKFFNEDRNYYLITKDNEIYDISFNELYSNNQNCKKRDINIEVKDIKEEWDWRHFSITIISKNNKIYDFNLKDKTDWYSDVVGGRYAVLVNDKDNNIKSILYTDNSRNSSIVLKNDNNIYKQYYNYNNGYKLEKEEIFLSNNEYGNILNAEIKYDNDKYSIERLTTDKGYYYWKEIKTDECIKYQDINCDWEFVPSEIYQKFSNDIKFVGEYYTILNDNSIIKTEYLTEPLDENLRD